jgi:hypothetical protein
MSKYIVSWERPYQGQGVSTEEKESYNSALGAYRRFVDAQCTPDCSRVNVRKADGTFVSAGQLRAWANKVKPMKKPRKKSKVWPRLPYDWRLSIEREKNSAGVVRIELFYNNALFYSSCTPLHKVDEGIKAAFGNLCSIKINELP